MMKPGFIGTGALTSAIVAGLKSSADNSGSVLLSPRNEQIAARLAATYPDVRVAADNQSVLDDSDAIMLAVRPQVAREVIEQLRFRSDHRVVSLVATLPLGEVAALTGPAERVTKALPIPMIAHRQGATIVYPPDPNVTAFFSQLGKVIEVEDPREFDALSVVTATFATYFKYLDTIHRWLKDHDVSDAKGRDYIVTLFQALANAPEAAPNADLMHLSEEYATRGGINEQVLRELTAHNLFTALAESLEGVHQRISRGGATPVE